MDLIKSLGTMAFGTRMKRLTERLMRGVSRVYKELDIDFEARWFPILYILHENILHKKPALGITEIARELGLTHPAVNQLAGEMARRGLVSSSRDPGDERRRLLSLTPEGQRLVGKLRPVWADVRMATEELLAETGNSFLAALEGLEKSLKREDIFERIMARRRARLAGRVRIVDYRYRYREDFRRLNYQWLEEYFEVEPHDEEVLADPEGAIIDRGGHIFMALAEGAAVGTAALMKIDERSYELAKMAVAPEVRRRGIGTRLLEAALGRAAATGAGRLYLETSPGLKAAVNLYKKHGFRRVAAGSKWHFKVRRESILMTKKLK